MPWTTPETFTAGQTLTAASMNIVSGDLSHLYSNTARGRLAYTSITSGTNSAITSLVDINGLSVTFTAEAGRYYRVSGYIIGYTVAVGATGHWVATIREGTTKLALNFSVNHLGRDASAYVETIRTFSAGSHTVKISAESSSASGGMNFVPLTDSPAWILVEDIGPA